MYLKEPQLSMSEKTLDNEYRNRSFLAYIASNMWAVEESRIRREIVE
jgi:hypothetical protein